MRLLIRLFEEHEADEWIRYGGELVFHPHDPGRVDYNDLTKGMKLGNTEGFTFREAQKNAFFADELRFNFPYFPRYGNSYNSWG